MLPKTRLGPDLTRLDDLMNLAQVVAWGAAGLLRQFYRQPQASLEISDPQGDSPVTAADLVANRYILEHLQAALEQDGFAYVSEETYHGKPAESEWVWVIDPLDGTRDFIDRTGEYALHIALVYRHRPVVAVVAWPEAEKLYFARLGGGTWSQTYGGEAVPLRVSERADIPSLRLVTSRTHRGRRFEALVKSFPFQERFSCGSIGCKIALILEQKADVYLSLSGKSAPKDWDLAAPELILTEGGGSLTTIAREPILYNQADINQWGGLLASNGKCHDQLCATATRTLATLSASS